MAGSCRGRENTDVTIAQTQHQGNRRMSPTCTRCLLLSLIVLATPLSRAGVIYEEGDVRLGFPASALMRWAVREGQWFPIQVPLQLEATPDAPVGMTVELRTESVDLDGDRVEYVRPDVTLTRGKPPQPVWCYAITQRSGMNPHDPPTVPQFVDIVTPERGVVATVPLPPFEPIDPDKLLVLDLSQQSVVLLSQLERQQTVSDTLVGRSFYREIEVGRMRSADLPDRWFGLEAVDILVWDRPDFDQVGDTQVRALIEWVRRGGELIIGIGGQATAVSESRLAEILPLTLSGASRTVSGFERFHGDYRDETPVSAQQPQYAVAEATARDDAVQLYWEMFDNRPGPLLACWNVGSGRVTACTGSLRELLGPGVQPAALGELFDLNPTPPELLKAEDQGYLNQGIPRRLFEPLVAQTQFAGVGYLFVLLATMFAAGYVLVAALVTWVWLQRLGRTTWSWPVFAVVAIAASALSLGAVRATRGLLSSAKSVAIVDLVAGERAGRGPCWFGYRSTTWDRLDNLWLPTVRDGNLAVGDNYLRPLTRARMTALYATPQRYFVTPSAAAADDVPMRATLKQFEGYWSGPLEGTIRGQVAVDRGSGRATPRCRLVNDLDVDLIGGYVFYVDPRAPGLPPARAGGNTLSYRPDLGRVPPAHNVLVLRLGELKAGDQAAGQWGGKTYADLDQVIRSWDNSNSSNKGPRPDLPTLHEAQVGDPAWRRVSGTGLLVGPLTDPVLLASFRDLYLHLDDALDVEDVGTRLDVSGVPDMDISHWLMRGQAVAILFADAPGPPRLYEGDRPLRTTSGRTVYRVRLPVVYEGRPPRGAAQ